MTSTPAIAPEILRYAAALRSGQIQATQTTSAILRAFLPPHTPATRLPRIAACRSRNETLADGGGGASHFSTLEVAILTVRSNFDDPADPHELADRLIAAGAAARLGAHHFDPAQLMVFETLLGKPSPTTVPRVQSITPNAGPRENWPAALPNEFLISILFIIHKTYGSRLLVGGAHDLAGIINQHHIKGRPYRPS